jgi:hypothetical protein
VDRQFLWGSDAKANFIAPDIDHSDFDVVTNDNGFISLSRQN